MKKATSAVLRKLFSKTNLKGKPLKFEWEKQTNGPEKTGEKWETRTEINENRKNILQAKMQEDYRIDMFDLRPKPQPSIVEEDELFGTKLPSMKPFDTAHFKEIYNLATYNSRNTLADKKLAYLSGFVAPFEIAETNLRTHLLLLQEEVKRFVLEQGGFPETVKDSQWEQFFTSPSIMPLIDKLGLLVQKANQVSLPNLILILSRDLHYNRDYSSGTGIYREIERSLHSLLHILSVGDLAKIYYGLTYVFPKKCSTELRNSIREQINNNSFNPLSVDEVLAIYTAFKNDTNCFKIHKKCVSYLIDNFEGLKRLCQERPALASNIVYTFANSRPSKRFRKKFEIINREQTDDVYEVDRIEELYMPLVVQHADTYGSIDFIRILSALKILNFKNYDEIYNSLEKFVLANVGQLSLEELSFILYYMTKTNAHGSGSRAFWQQIAKKIEGSVKFTPDSNVTEVARILLALSTNKVIDFKSFEKVFGSYVKAVFGEGQKVSYHDFAMIGTSLLYLDLAAPKDAIKPYLKNLIIRLSFHDEWVPIYYYHSIKMLTYYVSKRHPSWNLEYIINLSYHAEKHFNTERLRKNTVRNEFLAISSIIQKDLQMNLMSFVDFENLFLIDYAIEEYKFAVILQTDNDCLYVADGEERISHPQFDLKREILALHGWTICTIDYQEFTKLAEKRTTWLREKIQENYKKAVEKGSQMKEEKLNRVLERFEKIGTMDIRDDPTYPAHVHKADMLDKIKKKESLKKLQ